MPGHKKVKIKNDALQTFVDSFKDSNHTTINSVDPQAVLEVQQKVCINVKFSTEDYRDTEICRVSTNSAIMLAHFGRGCG